MIYFDSSALVKKYVQEAGSEKVFDLIARAGMPVTAKLAYPEILAGLGRKRREKGIGEKDFKAAVETFESDWAAFLVIEFQDELLPVIKQLSLQYALKGADLVHLASAVWFKRASREKIQFVASDLQLLKAAKSEKIEVVNPED